MLYKVLCLGLVSCVAAFALPPEIASLTGLSDSQFDELLPRASCPESINGTGIISGPSFPDEIDILKRNSFVKRDGVKLTLLGEEFRPVGANIYWLGLDENVIPDPSYPSRTRVLEAFADVVAMGGNAVRGHTLGISVGNPLSVEPSLDVFNHDAYEAIDFAVTAARIYGLKLVLPLIDNYNYYHGGKYQFIGWHGIAFNGTGANITPEDVGAYFYNTTSIVESFKRYIINHLTHVNRYTGLALKDDPTIFAWESGNELSAARFGDGPAPAAWTKEIGQLIKGLAPKQLFMDGSYGVFPETLDNEIVDIFGDHFYPPNITRLREGASMVHAAGRNYFSGELDWTGGGDDLTRFLSTVTEIEGAGDAYWSLFGHDDECCQYVEHDDGTFTSFYYLRANSPNVSFVDRGKILIDHAAQITGKPAPKTFQKATCPQTSFPKALIPPGFPL
ncbi:glycoside hydrolase [Vararia minispora EC-137]|uniref:Glycoside hydrolase n=1 Tax=Vararia minispora EC-137 TaxID=1314806 RepID=A0ACB8QGY5_9AGAM|nr:glycoside hydrolase [Vararia minispora EC-137]